MIRSFFFITLIFSLIHVNVFAGQEVGNGGNVILCTKEKPAVELIDLNEAKNMEGLTFQSPIQVKNYADLVTEKISILKEFDPVFAARIAEAFLDHEKKFQFVPNANLVQISDSLHFSIPADCKLKQVAIRKREIADGESRFLISKNLWQKMDLRSQAALILHELIYQDFINFGASDSRQARKLNAFLQSDQFFKITETNYLKVATTLPELHTHFKVGGIEYQSGGPIKLEFYPDGLIKRGTPVGNNAHITVNHNEYVFSNPNGVLEIEFYPNSIPKSAWLNQPTPIVLDGKKLWVEYLIQFKDSGEIAHASIVDSTGKIKEVKNEI